MNEPRTTDDFTEMLRLTEANRLKRERFTAADLLDLAHKQGFGFLSDGLLRLWSHRGVFPHAQDHVILPGERTRRGLWNREDAIRLLDLCALHEQNSRTKALRHG